MEIIGVRKSHTSYSSRTQHNTSGVSFWTVVKMLFFAVQQSVCQLHNAMPKNDINLELYRVLELFGGTKCTVISESCYEFDFQNYLENHSWQEKRVFAVPMKGAVTI